METGHVWSPFGGGPFFGSEVKSGGGERGLDANHITKDGTVNVQGDEPGGGVDGGQGNAGKDNYKLNLVDGGGEKDTLGTRIGKVGLGDCGSGHRTWEYGIGSGQGEGRTVWSTKRTDKGQDKRRRTRRGRRRRLVIG